MRCNGTSSKLTTFQVLSSKLKCVELLMYTIYYFINIQVQGPKEIKKLGKKRKEDRAASNQVLSSRMMKFLNQTAASTGRTELSDVFASTFKTHTATHIAYWSVAKALKSDGYVATPALKKLDNTYAVDDREKAKCLADSIKQHCSLNSLPLFPNLATSMKKEVQQKANLPPENDLPPVSLDEVQKLIRKRKTNQKGTRPGWN
ncbi:hypothetical protein EVAR_84611_1 [Eumeta japonica]|uniref:Uncharacterized protein n=1 Tax=Eumeta variegata TaxID=151549 RepID=A0A4C1UYD4_EUMVA|nr:hypothetical protein EVAR_84611_1 [Eumeta japonica]